jgi:lipoprotein-anchoring transpeptidase ErfK/SrfK
MGMRVLGRELGFDGEVEVVHPKRPLRRFLRKIARDIDREPRDARIDHSSGWVEVVGERTGRRLAVRKARRDLLRALDNGQSTIDLTVRKREPEVTADEFAQVLLLRIGENKLYLYQDGEITHSWTVATGQPGHSTPTGIFEVGTKRYMPTWYNPAPNGWGADMPLVIEPGPTNPLGVRALNWSGTLIRFHGTSDLSSLGRYASRGCVRLSNDEVVQLFDLVEEGTKIVSTWAPAA